MVIREGGPPPHTIPGTMSSDPTNTPRPSVPGGAITPLPVPSCARNLLLVGGSFDPPTLAHVRIAERARAVGCSPSAWIVFVPAARSPFKPDPPAADADRAAMLTLATGCLERAVVWTDELDRARAGAPSYWIDTLARARETRPTARFWFLIGADQAAAFHRWRDAHEILELASPLVVLREPYCDAAVLAAHLRATAVWSEDELTLWRDAVLPIPLVRGSATQARRALAAQPVDAAALDRLLDPAVLKFITEHDLYPSR